MRYEVIRHEAVVSEWGVLEVALYYVVIDHGDQRKIVYESRSRLRAHVECNKLNMENQRGYQN